MAVKDTVRLLEITLILRLIYIIYEQKYYSDSSFVFGRNLFFAH